MLGKAWLMLSQHIEIIKQFANLIMVTKFKHQIRQATEKDHVNIAKVSTICWQQAYKGIFSDAFLQGIDWQPRVGFREKFYAENKQVTGFVAEVDEQIVGFCDTGPALAVEDRPDIANNYGEIYALYVLQDFHRQGIGAALFQAACEYLIKQGFARCIIWSLEANAAGIKFYEIVGCTQQRWYKTKTVENKPSREVAFTIDLL